MVSCRFKGHNRSDRSRRIDKVQRGAEEARKGVGEGQPPAICSVEEVSWGSSDFVLCF